MKCYLLNLNVILLISCELSNCASPDLARTLQIFSGTLTEITCSAARPGFRIIKQEMQYDPDQYRQLPDLFDIEARLSPNRNNVTLFINGTSRSNNVTVICIDFTNFFSGQIDPYFTLLLEFISILPAPSHVLYNSQSPTGQLDLQIMWEPPVLLSNELSGHTEISIEPRITLYMVFVTTEETMIVNNTSETSFNIELDNTSCSLSFQVAAVNPAGIGERSPPQDVDWCMDSTSSTSPSKEDSMSGSLSAGIIAATAILICAVVSIVTIALFVVIATAYSKHKIGKTAQVFDSKGVVVAQNPRDPEDTHKNQKQTEFSSCKSAGDANQKHQKEIKTGQAPLIYAEVFTVKHNEVPEPSSVDPTKYSAVEHQHPNQVQDSGSKVQAAIP